MVLGYIEVGSFWCGRVNQPSDLTISKKNERETWQQGELTKNLILRTWRSGTLRSVHFGADLTI